MYETGKNEFNFGASSLIYRHTVQLERDKFEFYQINRGPCQDVTLLIIYFSALLRMRNFDYLSSLKSSKINI